MTNMRRPFGRVAIVGASLLVAVFTAEVRAETPLAADLACRSLAALYARVPAQFDPQDLAALQACIELQSAGASPGPVQLPGAQPVNRFPEQWPASAPWTTTSDPWPYPTMW